MLDFAYQCVIAWTVIFCCKNSCSIPVMNRYSKNLSIPQTKESGKILDEKSIDHAKGDFKNHSEIDNEVLLFLRKYGYLTEKQAHNPSDINEAIKSLRNIFGLKSSSRIDTQLLNRIRQSRCGNPDIEPYHKKQRTKRFAQISKWDNRMDKNDVLKLKWFIERYTKDMPKAHVKKIVQKAFKVWADQASMPLPRSIKLEFGEAPKKSESDIEILWAEGNHGDAYPFDGPGNTSNVLAHTFYPNYQENGTLAGDIHLDDYERWVRDEKVPLRRGTYLPYVLAHEIGHALGLSHSKRKQAVMNPVYKRTPLNHLKLDIDDKCAINWNYVGPSDRCLFIWLMVEILPDAPQIQEIAGLPPDPHQSASSKMGTMTVEDKIDQIFDNLQVTKLVPCLSYEKNQDDVIKSKYRKLLQDKLDLSQTESLYYANVMCDFLLSLRQLLESSKKLANRTEIYSNQISGENSYENLMSNLRKIWTSANNPISPFNVHSYHAKFYRLFGRGNLLFSDLPKYTNNVENGNFRRNIKISETFDEEFYRSIIRALLIGHEKSNLT